MRYYQDPRNVPLFRGRELLRLMTMIVMLGVVGMLVLRARDPRTWRWFATDNEKVSPATLKAFDKANGKKRQAAKDASRQESGESLTLASRPPRKIRANPAPPSKPPPRLTHRSGNPLRLPQSRLRWLTTFRPRSRRLPHKSTSRKQRLKRRPPRQILPTRRLHRRGASVRRRKP